MKTQDIPNFRGYPGTQKEMNRSEFALSMKETAITKKKK